MKLLFIDCCISQRGDTSRTATLCRAFLDAYRAAHPETQVETVDLKTLDLRPFDRPALDARDALRTAGEFGAPVYDLARQFREADHILVGAPFWDLSFPAVLRIYMEYISANGLTYYYDDTGCHGNCRGSRLAYLTTGGDVEGADTLGALYWKQLCQMFGIGRFDYVFAGGLDLDPAQTPTLLDAACRRAAALATDF